MINGTARFISIIGHPAVLMPITALIATHPGDHRRQFLSVSTAVLFAFIVFVYSLVKTKTGQWAHVDASVKSERKELNIAVSMGLFVGAAVLFLFNLHIEIVSAIALSGVIVLLGQELGRFVTPSLHGGFAIFAACLVLPNKVALVILLLFAIMIAWLRLHLKRHTPADLIIGAALGLFAGVIFQVLIGLK